MVVFHPLTGSAALDLTTGQVSNAFPLMNVYTSNLHYLFPARAGSS